jgi:hypothetical protein
MLKIYCVNDQTEVDRDNPQGMKWHILCYNNLGIVTNPRTWARKCLIFHYIKTNGIIALIKRLDAKHSIITKMFEDVNNLVEGSLERQLAQKRANLINNFLGID